MIFSSMIFSSQKTSFLTVLKRNFNHSTIRNLKQYMLKNITKIQWEENQTGFLRTTFPNCLFVPDQKNPPLTTKQKFRANFWYDQNPHYFMGDRSIHDHPNPFKSYIIKGGYEHQIYTVKYKEINFTTHNWKLLRQKTGITNLLLSHKYQYDKTTRQVAYCDQVILENTGRLKVEAGETINIDDQIIHRVVRFRIQPEIPTLSLNIVNQQGKGYLNLFLPNRSIEGVQTQRKTVPLQKRMDVTNLMIQLCSQQSITSLAS